MSSRGSPAASVPADIADELAGSACITDVSTVANFRSSPSSLLLLLVGTSSSSPHNRFISSSTRKKSSSLAEAIEQAIRRLN